MSGLARSAATVGLLGVALVHVLAAPEAFEEAPYQGWLFATLAVACVVVTGALAAGDPRAWPASTLLSLGAAAAYVASRTVGLPEGGDDVGDWSNALGIASLALEGGLAALGVAMLARRPSRHRPQSSRGAGARGPVAVASAVLQGARRGD